MKKPLMILVLMVCLVSSVWAGKEENAGPTEYTGEATGSRALWTDHLLWEGNATLREIAIGTKIKGVTDDTIRLFTVQSASPRQALLFTDTSSSSTTPMENRWLLDTLYTADDGYYSAEIGDVDRDGDNDLIFGRSSSPYKLMWWYWTGTGWNTDDTVICEISGTAYMYDIAIGDADNDGNPDDVIFTAYQAVMRAWWNGSSWDTLTLWSGDASTCYGVAIGDFDASHTGNEIVTVTYGGTVMGITWNSAMSTWDTATIYTPAAAWHLYDVEVGDFDSGHAGEEIAVANGGTIASTEGAIIEIYGSSGTGWSTRPLYTPSGSEYPRELAIGDCLDENAGDEIVYASSTSPYEARVVYGSGTTWDNQAIFTPGGTSYGVAVGDVDQYRADNDEIAVTGSYDVYEAEQLWFVNDLGVNWVRLDNPTSIINKQDTITVSIVNSGTAAQSGFNIGYSFKTNPATGTVLYSGTLPPATIDSVKIPFTFNALGFDTLYVYTMLPGDEYPLNDTVVRHIEVYDDSTVTASGFNAEDFPPQEWSSTVLVGTYGWQRYTSMTSPSGTVLEGDAVAGYNSYSASAGSMARLRTHAFNIGPTPKKIMLRFYMYGDDGDPTNHDSIYVEYSLDDIIYTPVAGFDRVDTVDAWRVFDVEIGDFAANMDVYIGLLAVSKYGYRMYIDSVRAYATTSTAPNTDAGVISIAPFEPPVLVGDSLDVTVTIRNYGLNALTSTPIYYTLGGADTTTETWTGNLLIGQTEDFTFSTEFVPPSPGDQTLYVGTALPGDQDPANDTMSMALTVCPLAHVPPYTKDFDEEWSNSTNPPFCGWSIVDGGTQSPPVVDNNDWHRYYYSTHGSELARIYYSPIETQDDWLISPRFDCSAEGTYTLSYWHYYNDFTTSNPDSARVLLSTDEGATWQLITMYQNADDSGYYSFDVSSLASGQSSVYIGFHYVAYNEYWWYIDDFAFDYVPDTTGPAITLVEMPGNTYLAGPYIVSAEITDESGIAADSLYYIIDDVATAVGHTSVVGDTFTYEIPTQSAGTCIDYYVMAQDLLANTAQSVQERFWVLSPLAPTDLAATGQIDSTVLLEWLPPGEELSYYDAIAYYWSGWAIGDMIATQFTPQHAPCKLEAFSMTFYDSTSYMDTVEVHVWDDDGAGNPGSDLWVDTIFVPEVYPNPVIFDVSAENITASGDFHVGLCWLGTDTPYPLSDAGALTSRSKSNGGAGWVAQGVDWVMSAVVSYVAPMPDVAGAKRVTASKSPIALNSKKQAVVKPHVEKSSRVVKHEIGLAESFEGSLLELILGISNFEVSRSEVQGGPYASIGTTYQSTYIDTTVTGEMYYYYVVQANYTAPETISYYSNEALVAVDLLGPAYANTTFDTLVGGPWVVSTDITDWTGIAYDSLGYRADSGAFAYVTSDSVSGDTYYYTIPSYPSYTLIEFYLFSQDASMWQNEGRDPATDYYMFTVTAVSESDMVGVIPDRVFLGQSQPNPFAHFTQIEYGVPRNMKVNISVYNAVGQRVSTLVDEIKAPGFHKVNWLAVDAVGRRLSEGVYFVRMTTDELIDNRKVIFIK
jgi:hypothetical protein